MYTKYTKELLEEAVASSLSMANVLRLLGIKQTGGSQSHITKMVKRYGISTEHFTGKGHNKGKTYNRTDHSKYLVMLDEGSNRPKAKDLRRAMIAEGLTQCCSSCTIKEWNGQEIVLDIDHIDGNWLNNKIENLRFLCPNCHRQTETFGNKIRKPT